MITKICGSCGQELPITEFHRNSTYSCGFAKNCRPCLNEKYRKKNPLKDNKIIPLEGEVWKDIIGYENYYMISNRARIYVKDVMQVKYSKGLEYKSFVQGKMKSINLSKCKKQLYLQVGLSGGKQYQTFKLHRLVAMHFIPNPDNKPHVNHIDANKLNNLPENLEWCTHLENVRHAISMGLKPPAKKGEDCNFAKLTEDKVREIRKLKGKLILKDIAAIYGTSISNISDVLNNVIWRHVA